MSLLEVQSVSVVFGGLVAFGTVALRILSFSFIPAMFTFVKEEKLEKFAQTEDVDVGGVRQIREMARDQ